MESIGDTFLPANRQCIDSSTISNVTGDPQYENDTANLSRTCNQTFIQFTLLLGCSFKHFGEECELGLREKGSEKTFIEICQKQLFNDFLRSCRGRNFGDVR